MRTVYRVLAYAVAIEVVVQAMAVVWAMAGLGKWIDDGGVADKALFESEDNPFPEVAGFMIHGVNGMMIIPLIALVLLVVSFFARVPGGVKWAGLVLLLVVVQATLGLAGHAVPGIGGLHGLNALLLFATALHTARRSSLGTAPAAATAPRAAELSGQA